MLSADWQLGGFGLYLHWPFCATKCPYCDFNSHVVETIDQSRWRRAYLAELERAAAETEGRVLQTIYFGGGTPSLMDPETVGAILDRVSALWTTSNQLEITLEANPGSVEVARFRALRSAGVNRVSIGVQALSDRDLHRLGRSHSAAEARRALEIARTTFDRINFDLIYARQDQTLSDWKSELAEALTFGSDHLSLYQLTVEPGTVFARRFAAGKLSGLPHEELAADMYELTQDMTDAAGYPAYEVSNHAGPGGESRHNLIYWRAGDYIGLGPGAHGRLTTDGRRSATECHASPSLWLQAVETRGSGEMPRDMLTARDRALEYLMMGLRITEGLDLERLLRMHPEAIDTSALAELRSDGYLLLENNILKTTKSGRLLLNEIIRRLAVS